MNEIDAYIASFPNKTQVILQKIRGIIQELAPQAKEAFSYQMPTFKLNGNLIHFAAYKNHIGLYPTPSAVLEFKDELNAYKNAKGSVQFPLNQPMPYHLIERIVMFRVKQNTEKALKKT